MKLSDLFPSLPKLILGGKECELKFTTRSMLQLEKDYPEKIVKDKIVTTEEQIITALNSGFTGMKPTDIVNLLYAGLIHTKSFADKEILVDAMEPCYFPDYIHNILMAFRLSKMTPEQQEKLEVMNQTSKSKKKEPAQETTPESTPSIDLNAK